MNRSEEKTALFGENYDARRLDCKIEGRVDNGTMTRIWMHECSNEFALVTIGQVITVKRGPFAGRRFRVLGKLSNRFDKFYFVDPNEVKE